MMAACSWEQEPRSPASSRALKAAALVQTVGAVDPEFHCVRLQPEPGPVRRSDNVAPGELRFGGGMPVYQLGARGQLLRLV